MLAFGFYGVITLEVAHDCKADSIGGALEAKIEINFFSECLTRCYIFFSYSSICISLFFVGDSSPDLGRSAMK